MALQSPTGASPHGASAVLQLLFRPCGTHLRAKHHAGLQVGSPSLGEIRVSGFWILFRNCSIVTSRIGPQRHNITVGRRYQAETAAGPTHSVYSRGLGVTAVTVDGDPFHSRAWSTRLIK